MHNNILRFYSRWLISMQMSMYNFLNGKDSFNFHPSDLSAV